MGSNQIDIDAQISSAKSQLKLYGTFLESNDKLLNNILFENSDNTNERYYRNNIDQISVKICSPVTINYSPCHENISILEIIKSDNKILNKIITTFASLCNEVDKVKIEAESYQLKFLYIDEDLCTFEEKGRTDECYIKISSTLNLLLNIQQCIKHCSFLAKSILQQLGAFFTFEKQLLGIHLTMEFQGICILVEHRIPYYSDDSLPYIVNREYIQKLIARLEHVCLKEIKYLRWRSYVGVWAVFDRLNTVIVQLIIFDEILSSSIFYKYWTPFMRTIRSVSKNLDQFKNGVCNDNQITGIIHMLNEIEAVFNGNIFQTFLDSTFILRQEMNSKDIAKLAGHFLEYIKTNLGIIDKFTNYLSIFYETELIIKMNAFSVLYLNFFGNLDPKCFKHLIDYNNKHIGIVLIGNIIWCPEMFLKKHAETLLVNHEKYLMESVRLRQTFLQTKVKKLFKDTRTYCIQISSWALKISTALRTENYDMKLEQFKQRCTLFLQGLQYAGQLSHVIKSVTNLHVFLRIPFQKTTLRSIYKLIEYLKIIFLAFNRDIENVSKTVQSVAQYLQYKILFIITSIKQKLSNEPYNERTLDIISALQIAEKCMHGPVTKERLLITSLAISAANLNRTLGMEYVEKFNKAVQRLELIGSLRENVEKLCDTNFLYWHQAILSKYLRQVIDKKCDFHSFYYIIKSSDDCTKQFHLLNLIDMKLIEKFKLSNFDYCKNEIINKLCAQIETYLRFEVHANLPIDQLNPFTEEINDYRNLINIHPMQINGKHIVIKDHVENYLSNVFYNFTTISLNDWKDYCEMRHLAKYKYNINMIEDQLPTQNLEQNIDVLEIMRNINVFVSKYVHNMNHQIFIEHSSDSKFLNTIGIKQIANSLRTHGTGIINTTVNFTYQFLRKKFNTFSQFMFDEHIKSRLMKDSKYFRDNKEKLNHMYCFDRADSFNKGIRKLGLSPEGYSYLDLFRQLITHIGNAMGYIRLIRSGAMNAGFGASIYLPKLDDNLKFSMDCNDSELSDVTIKAAENLESNIKNLTKNFCEGTDYFRLLVDAFAPFFRDNKNMHLKYFYLIIPPLTINFVEYIINAKDKINKKDKNGAVMFDDGFIIGLAYILKLLNQITDFNSLHWFKSVKQKYKDDLIRINKQNNPDRTSIIDEKLNETLLLTQKRINAHQMEFDLLYYNLCSSKIFFK